MHWKMRQANTRTNGLLTAPLTRGAGMRTACMMAFDACALMNTVR